MSKEWIWFGEDDAGREHVSFARWQSHPCQLRYKLAEVQPTEHDHPADALEGGVTVRATKLLPSQEILRQLLRYEPETGKLFWRDRTATQMRTADPRGKEWAANQWNSRSSGKEAFTATDPRGYKHGKVFGVNYQAHRVIWKLVYGVEPDTIDHRNGDQGDNRLANLRDCSNAENSRNYEKPRGSSQYRGVCWVKRDSAWAARISDGKGGKRSLGNHQDEIEAARAYDRAAREMHGEFATLNFPDEVQP